MPGQTDRVGDNMKASVLSTVALKRRCKLRIGRLCNLRRRIQNIAVICFISEFRMLNNMSDKLVMFSLNSLTARRLGGYLSQWKT